MQITKKILKNFKIMEKQIKLDIVKYYKNLLDKGLNIGSEEFERRVSKIFFP